MGRNRRKQAAGPRLAVFPGVMRIRLQMLPFFSVSDFCASEKPEIEGLSGYDREAGCRSGAFIFERCFAGIKNGDLFGVSVMRGRIISAGCYSSIKSMFTCRWNASCSEIWVSVEETP